MNDTLPNGTSITYSFVNSYAISFKVGNMSGLCRRDGSCTLTIDLNIKEKINPETIQLALDFIASIWDSFKRGAK